MSKNYVCKAYRATKLAISDFKLFALVVILSTQENTKLLQQIKSGFNPNKAGLFEGSLGGGGGGGQFDPPSYFKKNLSNF